MSYKVHSIYGVVDGHEIVRLMIPEKGCVDFEPGSRIASIRCLFVNPSCRRKGVASALFREAFRIADLMKKTSMTWTVRKDNKAAVKFYLNRGAVCCYEVGDEWVFAIPVTDPK